MIVYFATDGNPTYTHLVKTSLTSLRRQNTDIPVMVFLFNRVPEPFKKIYQGLGAETFEITSFKSIPKTFYKWIALRHLSGHSQVLYVDADTLFFADPEDLLQRCLSADFYAREELGTCPGVGHQLVGNKIIRPQFNHKLFNMLADKWRFQIQPIFNSGVMIFNRNFASTVGSRIPEMLRIRKKFIGNFLFYPSHNEHLIDEIVASIVFGKIPEFSCERLPKEISPWYIEWKSGVVKSPGMVMHSWSNYAPFMLNDLESTENARKLPFEWPIEFSYRQY